MKNSERGSVTAEFALLIPAVLGLFVVLFSAFSVQLQRFEMQADASTAARALARGEDQQFVLNWLAEVAPKFEVSLNLNAESSCVSLVSANNVAGGDFWQLSEKSCARNLGW